MFSQCPFEACTQVDASVAPSLLELSVREFSKHYRKYKSFEGVPSDYIQLVLNCIVKRQQPVSRKALGAFSNCALLDFPLADCIGVDDSLMPIVASQGLSLLKLDISHSGVTDKGLALLAACTSLKSLTMNDCLRISDRGLSVLQGFSNLTTLSLRGSFITPAGTEYFVHLAQLRTLDLEGCSSTLGGLQHIQALTTLQKLDVGCRVLEMTREIRERWVAEVENLAGLVNLVELHISWNVAQPSCISPLKGLTKLQTFHMEGCYLDEQALDVICGMTDLRCLDIGESIRLHNGFQKLGGLVKLRKLDIGWTEENLSTGFLKELTDLERLYLCSNPIKNAGLESVQGLVNLRVLDISSTHVQNDGLRLLSGLTKLESLDIGATGGPPFDGLCAITTITSLRHLNLNCNDISDAALLSLVALTGLLSLELWEAKITNVGMSYLRHFRNLQTLDLCWCAITDAGLREIAPLTSLTYLDISQNNLLTDDALKHLSGMRNLVTLNLASTSVTFDGLQQHLMPLTQLRILKVSKNATSEHAVRALLRFRDKLLPNLRVNFSSF